MRSWFLADRTEYAVSNGDDRPERGKEWREGFRRVRDGGIEEQGGRGC